LTVCINGPLSRWKPRWALSSGEVAVAFTMVLVSCALPSSGLMRYLPGHLAGIYYHAGTDYERRVVLEEIGLPDWMFPSFDTGQVITRSGERVIQNYWTRTPVAEDTFAEHARAVPWGRWVRPALTWGIFIAGLYGAILCLSVIVRRQWVENERLPFPLASLYLSLIEPPPPGGLLNSLFRARSFWIAFTVVFLIHGMNAMHLYDPRIWPEIPKGYNSYTLLAERPWYHIEWSFKETTLYFSIIGICYFLQTNVAFSLWFLHVMLLAVGKMVLGESEIELTGGMRTDQTFGAFVPFALAALWIGRQHWAMVARQMFGRTRDGEARGRYLPHAVAGWGLVLSVAVMFGWLWTAGMTPIGAALVIVMMLSMLFVVARVVAETGLPFVQIYGVSATRPWIFALSSLPQEWAGRTSLRSFFLTSFMSTLTMHDMRESLPVYATSALRVADDAAYPDEKRPGRALPLVLALVLALGVGYLVSGAAMLYCEYTHAVTQDLRQEAPINKYGTDDSVRDQTYKQAVEYRAPRTGPAEQHNRVGHFAFGAGVTTILSVLRLRYVNWPLHPVGFLLAYSYPMMRIWLSILIGWLLKLLVVRFGGTQLYRAAKPAFIGMIIGEAGAAACWLIVSLVLNALGYTYHAVNLLPT
jgi:hypothetical protein